MFSAGAVSAALEGRFNPVGFTQFDAAMKRSGAMMDSQEKKMAAAGSKMSRSVAMVGKAGGVLAGVGLAAVVVGVAKSVKAAAEFEKGMRNVNTIAKVSEGSLKSLGKQVLKLSTETGQGPADLAAGLYDIVSSGFKADDAIKILEKSSRAAAAGMTDTATSTKAVVAVLNAYGLGADTAGHVSDQLFGIVDRGVISFEELSSQIGDLLPYAPKLGLGLNEIGASIATITKGGTGAAETMTQIKGVMVQFLGPNDALAAAIKRTGFATGEQLVKSKGLQGALEAVAGTTNGTSTAMRGLFPEIRSLSGALALTGDKAKGAHADLKAMSDVSGKTEEALAEQAKGASFQWDRFKASLKVAGIELGTGLLPSITEGVEEMTDVINEMAASGDLEQMGKDLGEVVSTLVEAGPLIASSMSMAVSALGPVIKALQLGALGMLAPIQAAAHGFLLLGKAVNAIPGLPDIPLDGLEQQVNNIDGLMKDLTNSIKGVDKQSPTIKIKGDASQLTSALKRVQSMKLEDQTMKILATGDSTVKQKIKALINLGIPPKTAKVLAENADALAKLRNVQAALAAIQSKRITIETTRIENVRKTTTPVHPDQRHKEARGSAGGYSRTALVGEGRGPELVTDGQSSTVVTGPTLMDLGPEHSVIPFGDPSQSGRALGLLLGLFGIEGYAKGKKPKKAKAKKPKEMPVPPAVQFGAVPEDELNTNRDQARERYQKRKERVRDLDVDIRAQRRKVQDAKGKARGPAKRKLADLQHDRRRYNDGGDGLGSLADMRKKWQDLQKQATVLRAYNRDIEKLNTQQETERTRMATAAKLGDEGGWDAAKGKRGGILTVLRDKYAKALKLAKPGSSFAAELEGKLAGIQGEIADIGAEDFTNEISPAQQAAQEAADRLADTGMTDAERATLDHLQAAQALASLTAGLEDDQSTAGMTEQFLTGILGAAMRDPSRGGASAIRSLADQVKQARDNVASFAGGGTAAGNDNADVAAQLAQRDEQLRVAQRESEVNRLGLAAFQGAGDIGMGGPRVVINTLHPGDPATLRAIGDAAVGGMGLQSSVSSNRTHLGL